MKHLALFFCIFASLSLAGAKEPALELPKGLFVLGQLEQAKTQAAAEKKPIAFLITREGSEDNFIIKATEEFVDVIDKKTVIVYVGDKQVDERTKALPELVLTALKDMKKKPRIPIVIITDASTSNVLASVAYNQFVDRDEKIKLDEAVDHLKKEMRRLAALAKETAK